jgi:hypothetical protein
MIVVRGRKEAEEGMGALRGNGACGQVAKVDAHVRVETMNIAMHAGHDSSNELSKEVTVSWAALCSKKDVNVSCLGLEVPTLPSRETSCCYCCPWTIQACRFCCWVHWAWL